MEPEASRMNPQSSTLQYLAEQVLRAPYMETDSVRALREHLLNGMNESILREMEKQRIRDEIIMEEIVIRRVLEAEVRREMMMEREFPMWRGNGGFRFASSPLTGFDSFTRPPVLGLREKSKRVEEILPFSIEKMREVNVSRESDSLPFQRAVDDDLRISEVNKLVLEKGKEKEKIYLQAKPEEAISGLKRKAGTPPGEDNSEAQSDIVLNKKSENEWSYSHCQISATSEQDLKEHVEGKKHKTKDASYKSQRAGKNYSIVLSTKRATVPEEENIKIGSESLVCRKSDAASSKTGDLSKFKEENVNEIEVVQKNDDHPKGKKLRFWCEICEVWTLTNKIMKVHNRGRKHMRRLETRDLNAEGVAECGKSVYSEIVGASIGEAGSDNNKAIVELAEVEEKKVDVLGTVGLNETDYDSTNNVVCLGRTGSEDNNPVVEVEDCVDFEVTEAAGVFGIVGSTEEDDDWTNYIIEPEEDLLIVK